MLDDIPRPPTPHPENHDCGVAVCDQYQMWVQNREIEHPESPKMSVEHQGYHEISEWDIKSPVLPKEKYIVHKHSASPKFEADSKPPHICVNHYACNQGDDQWDPLEKQNHAMKRTHFEMLTDVDPNAKNERTDTIPIEVIIESDDDDIESAILKMHSKPATKKGRTNSQKSLRKFAAQINKDPEHARRMLLGDGIKSDTHLGKILLDYCDKSLYDHPHQDTPPPQDTPQHTPSPPTPITSPPHFKSGQDVIDLD